MSRPPRIPVMLPWECRVIYFVTICITPRCKALANDAAWKALRDTLERLDKWNTYCVMMVPDHIHLVSAPLDRDLSVAAFLKWLKRWFNESYDERREWRCSRVALTVFFERRNQFTRSGTTFERIWCALV
jgi:REP element-mobilizing transposase RayT